MELHLKFKGTWRSYQARVLQRSDKYLRDNRIHIVAAPGSGKTTLGIELIARLDQPTLILAPSIVIRQQWENRIIEAFLEEGVDPTELISQELKHPKRITIATYQALHSAMTKLKGEENHKNQEEELDDISESETIEEVDYSSFELIQELKSLGVETLCLDECHHLRSEWWKALEDFKKGMGDITTIALTATPPYDSTPSMWKRYLEMCGEIDEEITIPELVREGSLCPHQDYIYFNYPSAEEQKSIDEYQNIANSEMKAMLKEEQFIEAVRFHPFLDEKIENDMRLDNPSYFAALLIFLNELNLPYSEKFLKLLGVKTLPNMEEKWMEILLQQFLYDDVDQFFAKEEYKEALRKRLKKEGLIQRRKVYMTNNAKTEKMLLNSKGKAESIKKIVKCEYDNLGHDLRMVILTDYIRKEYLNKVGEDFSQEVPTLGVLPFFEMLRQEYSKETYKPKLGILCGSVVIIPAQARHLVEELVGTQTTLSFSKVGQLETDEYLLVDVVGKRHILTTVVTEVFNRGEIEVLIGTKSLLGEGWDSPCINSLILASFVGSFMLSNQMRGRAIRVMKDNPDKTANIWHLVCVKPLKIAKQEAYEEEREVSMSEDCMMLQRRMEHFLGLHFKEDTIECGIQRMDLEDISKKGSVNRNNRKMIEASKRRSELKSRWEKCLEVYSRPEVVNQVEISDRLLKTALITEGLRGVIFATLLSFVIYRARFLILLSNIGWVILLLAYLIILGVMIVSGLKVLTGKNPYRKSKMLGKSMRKALEEQELFEDARSKVETEVLQDPNEPWLKVHSIFLLGGTGRDKDMFAKCMMEFFAPIDNQKYLLVRKNKLSYDFFAVPELFSRKKEMAQKFCYTMQAYMGNYQLVYTRTEEGRKMLLKGRAKGFASKNYRLLSGKKVKNALE